MLKDLTLQHQGVVVMLILGEMPTPFWCSVELYHHDEDMPTNSFFIALINSLS